MRIIKIMYLQYVAYVLIILLATGHLLKIGKFLLAPLAIAGFLSIAFHPILRYISKYIKSNLLSVVVLMFINTIIIGGIGLIIFSQLQNFIRNYANLAEKINNEFMHLKVFIAEKTGIEIFEFENMLEDYSHELINSGSETAISFMGDITSFLSYIVLIPLYFFLLLLYRKTINKKLKKILSGTYLKYQVLVTEFSSLIQNYLKGLMIVMLLMGLMNSVGLWILKVPYAFVLGFFVALFTIVPYVGIFAGGFIVLVISYATQGSVSTLLLIVLLFGVIQFIEGNFLTPSIVGNKLNVNSLVAILALLAGGQLWGIVGMILAIPSVAAITLFVNQFQDKVFYDQPRKNHLITNLPHHV